MLGDIIADSRATSPESAGDRARARFRSEDVIVIRYDLRAGESYMPAGFTVA
jgi:hypothetical protein